MFFPGDPVDKPFRNCTPESTRVTSHECRSPQCRPNSTTLCLSLSLPVSLCLTSISPILLASPCCEGDMLHEHGYK